MADQRPLRIAVPNKGALSGPAGEMMFEAGYRQRRESKELVVVDPDNGAEFFYLRPRDIAVYVANGQLDVGITGRDLLIESGSAASEILPLGFARSTFRYAGRADGARDPSEFGGLTIATSYENIVAKHLESIGIEAAIVHLDGAVETSIELGVADVIADVVETGTSLRNAGLTVIGDPIMTSEAVVIARSETVADQADVAQFIRRLTGVLVARSYVMMDYDCRTEHLEAAVRLTPGLESPTVSPLHDEGWVAVRAMVERSDAQRIMDDLYGLGARAILTTAIDGCRI